MSSDNTNFWWQPRTSSIEFCLGETVFSISGRTLADFYHTEYSESQAQQEFVKHKDALEAIAKRMQTISLPRSQAPHFYLPSSILKMFKAEQEDMSTFA